MDAKLLPVLLVKGRNRNAKPNSSIAELVRVAALLGVMALCGFLCGAALSSLADRANAYQVSAALLAASAPPQIVRRLGSGGNDSGGNTTAAPPRIALLHKGHGAITARGLAAAVLAQREVLEAGGWYGFLYSSHPSELPDTVGGDNGNGNGGADAAAADAEAARASLLALRAALGDGAVFAVGRAEVAAALGEGLLAEQRRVFGPDEWAWATNDAVDAAWFALHGDASLPPWARHLWLAELDVGWTGGLPATLESTVPRRHVGADATGTAARGPDFVAFAVEQSNAGWRWHAARNWLADGDVWRCYRHAARLSRALLAAHLGALRQGRVASDEAMAPSVCAREKEWCLLDAESGGGSNGSGNGTGSSWRPGHPAVGTDAETGEALYRWELRIDAQRWARIVRADKVAGAACAAQRGAACPPGRLYHALKW